MTPAAAYPGELVLTSKHLFFLPNDKASPNGGADGEVGGGAGGGAGGAGGRFDLDDEDARDDGFKKWPQRERCVSTYNHVDVGLSGVRCIQSL